MHFTELREALGETELLKIVQSIINSDTPERPHVPLHDTIIETLTSDPIMLNLLLSATELLRDKPEVAIGLVEKAFTQAASPAVRQQIKGLALKFRLACKFRKKAAVDLKQFTASQARAFQRLQQMSELFFSGATHCGVTLRVNPMLVGPSGVGKTHLVNALAESLELPLMRLTVGDWLITGSKADPTTLESLQGFISDNRQGVVFIDELDKMRSQESAWSQCVLTEVFSVIDRQVSYQGAKGRPWTPDHTARLKKKIFIIGAGTWHGIWAQSKDRAMGFRSDEAAVFDGEVFTKKVRDAGVIPDELLNRFNDDWLLLEPYTATDYVTIVRNMGIDPGAIDPVAAAQSGLNFRFVERALTNAALKRISAPAVIQE